MKKFLITLCLLWSISSVFAEKNPVYTETKFSIAFDFSSAKLDKVKSESIMIQEYGESWEKRWNSQKEHLIYVLIKNLNSTLSKYTYATVEQNDKECPYLLDVLITTIDDDGEVAAAVSLSKQEDLHNPISNKELSGDGGESDNYLILSDEGFANLGKEIAYFLSGHIKTKFFADNFLKAYAGYSIYGLDHESTGSATTAGVSYFCKIAGIKVPLFIEAGLEYGYYKVENKINIYNMNVSTGEYTQGLYGINTTIHRISVPVNVTYIFSLNRGIQIAPFIGEALCYNIADEGEIKAVKSDFKTNLDFGDGVNQIMPVLSAGVNLFLKDFIISYRYQQSETTLYGEFSDNSHLFSLGLRF